MSTRALIAMPYKQGFMACWNWYDAYPSDMGARLRTSFKTVDSVKQLIQQGMIGRVYTTAEILSLFGETALKTGSTASGDSFFVKLDIPKSKGLYVSRAARYDNKPKFYRSIKDMLQEDINYVYVFDPEKLKWSTYKWNTYK